MHATFSSLMALSVIAFFQSQIEASEGPDDLLRLAA